MKIKATLLLGVLFTLAAVLIAVTHPGPELPDGIGVLYTVLIIAGPSMILLGGVARQVDNHLTDKKRNPHLVLR